MSSISHCLKKMGLSEHEGAILRGRIDDLKAEGYDAHQAAVQAVKDHIGELQADRAKVVAAMQPEKPKPESDFKRAARKRFIDAIKAIGGIELKEVRDITGEGGFNANKLAPGLFRKAGKPLDLVAEMLHEKGYLTAAEYEDTDGGVQRVRDLVRQALDGNPVYTMAELDDAARAQLADAMADEHGERGLSPEAAREAIDGMPDDYTGEEVIASFDAATYLAEQGITDPDLVAAISEAAAIRADSGEDYEQAVKAEAESYRTWSQTGGPGHAEASGEAPALELTGETNAEVLAAEEARRQREAEQAAAAKAADDKAAADRERDDFALSGSNRPADLLASQGQGDLLGAAPISENSELSSEKPDTQVEIDRLQAQADELRAKYVRNGSWSGEGARAAQDKWKALVQKARALREESANPERETITPANDKSLGANAAGELLYERADGSRYRMHYGKPDFGGDLVAAGKGNAEQRGLLDVGENLMANRRNLYVAGGLSWDEIKDHNDALKVREVQKPKVWPKPDYEQMVAPGEDGISTPMARAIAARMVKMVYDGIAAKPGKTSDEALQRYVQAVQRVRDAMTAWFNDQGRVLEFFKVVGAMAAQRTQKGPISFSALIGDQAPAKRLSSTFVDAIWPEMAGKEGLGRRVERDSEMWKDLQALGGNKAFQNMQPSIDDVVKAMKEIEDGWPASKEAWERQKYRILEPGAFTVAGSPVTSYDRETGKSKETGDMYWRFETQGTDREARGGLKLAGSETGADFTKKFVLVHNRNVLGLFDSRDQAVEAAREATRGQRNNEGADLRGTNVENTERTGPERRTGDVTSEDLKTTFGFRGVNFGREGYIKAAERQAYVNAAYDGLHDMAELLGLPPKALSLNGMLGIAFGAQGHGGNAAAHFVPGYNEINLTKTMGAGTLAHEWGHALDHYFATLAGQAKSTEPWLSVQAPLGLTEKRYDAERKGTVEVQRFAPELRREVLEAVQAIVAAMKKRDATPEETARMSADHLAKAKHSLDGWLKAIKQNVMMPDQAGYAEFSAKYDAIAARIRNGEPGGYVKSGNLSLPQAVAEIRELSKAVRGRYEGSDNTKGLMHAATYLQHLMAKQAATAEHVPQKVSTDYALESSRKDAAKSKSAARYWSTPWEMFARAFEAYVADRLQDRGQVNTFLSDARIRAAMKSRDDETKFAHPYPRGVDATAINSAFDKLIGTLQVKTTGQGEALYSLRPGSPGFKGMAAGDVQAAIAQVTAQWNNGPPISVVQQVSELPRPAPAMARGMIYQGHVYLVASNLKDAQAAQFVLLHETTGHYGLAGVFGDELNPLLRRIYDSNDAVRLGADQRQAYYRANGREISIELATEETLADMAGKGTVSQLNGWQLLAAAIRRVLRRLGFNLAMSDNDVAELLRQARQYVERPAVPLASSADRAEPAFQAQEPRFRPTQYAPDQWAVVDQHPQGVGIAAWFKTREETEAYAKLLNEKLGPAFNMARPPFYSALTVGITRAPFAKDGTIAAGQLKAWLDARVKEGTFKKDEVEWSGLNDYLALAGKDRITRDQLTSYLVEQGTRVEERLLTDHPYDDFLEEMQAKYGDNFDASMLSPEDRAEYERLASEPTGAVATKFARHTLPGGQNYRELLITLPRTGAAELRAAQDAFDAEHSPQNNPAIMERLRRANAAAEPLFRSPHFDQPNVLVHLRLNERTDAAGKRVLFIEELQSDWAQKGRKEGFITPQRRAEMVAAHDTAMDRTKAALSAATAAVKRNDLLGFDTASQALNAVVEAANDWRTRWQVETAADAAALDELALAYKNEHRIESQLHNMRPVPAAPFVQDTKAWVGLALKRAIRFAADEGFDRIAWTTGEQQADRYNLSRHVERIEWVDEDSRTVAVRMHEGAPLIMGVDRATGKVVDGTTETQGKTLDEIIGKDLAKRIIEAEEPIGAIKGLDLAIGGRGMYAFYDQIVPQVARELLRKFGGGELGQVKIRQPSESPAESLAFRASHPEIYGAEGAASAAEQRDRTITQPGFELTDAMRDRALDGLPLFSLPTDGMAGAAVQYLQDHIKSPKSFGLLQGFQTQLHKALTHPFYRPVYQAVQRFLLDTSRYANEAADRAGDILPRLKDAKEIFSLKELTPSFRRDLAAVGKVTFLGTLADIRPTDEQLAAGFAVTDPNTGKVTIAPGLTPKQIEKWHQARAAIDLALDQTAASEMIKLTDGDGVDGARADARLDPERAQEILAAVIEPQVAPLRLRAETLAEVAKEAKQTVDELRKAVKAQADATLKATLREQLNAAKKDLTKKDRDAGAAQKVYATKKAVLDGINALGERAQQLKDQGYAPLMRFGEYTVNATVPGEREGTRKEVFFAMYESRAEANQVARAMQEEFGPDAFVTTGTMDEASFKLYRGLSLDALAAFANVTGLSAKREFQEFYKLALSSRSALKRLIHRQGIAGYDEDLPRVLSSFLTANARLAARNLHLGEAVDAQQAIPKELGQLRTDAANMIDYVQNPSEEAHTLRGFLFVNFLGGSIAAAAVNATQPVLMTSPWLSQYSNPFQAVRALAGALKVGLHGIPGDVALQKALELAESEGITEPQEIHQLYAESIRNGFTNNLLWRKFSRVWGGFFSAAESFNRRITFAAAWRLADQVGIEQINAARAKLGMPTVADNFDFARTAVDETQGVYNRGNRPNYARGPVGATVFTFKQFSISYLEFLARLPAREKAIAVALLVMAAGVQGLPGAGDLEDLIDALGQMMGFSTNSKKAVRQWATQHLYGNLGAFLNQGLSGIPGSPFDVSQRLGFNNLAPGLNLLKRSDEGREASAGGALGAAGAFGQQLLNGWTALEEKQYQQAAASALPIAVQNGIKAADMWSSGYYRDIRGRRVVAADHQDAIVKALGFQPFNVADASQAARDVMQDVALEKNVEGGIANRMARARVDADPAGFAAALADLQAWNARNPGNMIRITPEQIASHVKNLLMERKLRLIKAAPPEARAGALRDLQ